MAVNEMANAGALGQWSSPSIVLNEWADLATSLDAFVDGSRRDQKYFRGESFLFRGAIYTVEFLPANDTPGMMHDHGRDNGKLGPTATGPHSDSPYPKIRVSVRTADRSSCHPARDFWPRFIGTLSRLLARVTDSFDKARRKALGSDRLFQSCEQAMERYAGRKLGQWHALGKSTIDIEAVFSDRGMKV